MFELPDAWAPLPLATSALPGVGGVLRAEIEDFVVVEIPLYRPSGSGEHVYVTLERRGVTTRDVAQALARLFRLREVDVGQAGLKDQRAIATQTFSLHAHTLPPEEAARLIEGELGWRVLSAARHANKLRTGHLIGNRFELRVRRVHAEAASRAAAITGELAAHGWPNFFGAQRFGSKGDNALRGARRVGERPRGFADRMLLSAWQASLFNAWGIERMRQGTQASVLLGDIAKRRADGALFEVLDVAAESERALQGEIAPSGPMFGSKMRWAKGEPGLLERALLEASGIDDAALARSHLDGTRRLGWIHPQELEARVEGGDLLLRFRLPKGAYATVLAREFTKDAALAPEEAVDD